MSVSHPDLPQTPRPALPLIQDGPPRPVVARLRDQDIISATDGFERLSGGRTNRVWLIRRSAANLVLKTYRNVPDNPLFANDAEREVSCLKALAGTGLAPRLCAWGKDDAENWVVYRHVTGTAWRDDVRQAADLLAGVHRQKPPVGLVRAGSGSAALAAQTEGILDRCRSPDGRILRASAPRGRVPPAPRLHLIHGDPVPGNIVQNGESATLIDWQCPAVGDPSEDLALFLSPAMQAIYRGKPLGQEDEDGFLARYPLADVVQRYLDLRPWYHWRMAAYCLWQSERGAADYAGGLKLEMQAMARYGVSA